MPAEIKEHQKSAITPFFFFDQSLGLPAQTEEEVERKELAQEVLSFMWSLCLDEVVLGIIEHPMHEQNQLI